MTEHGLAVEDAVLGPAYDRRLVTRIWRHARAYRGPIAGSAALFPLLAGLDLLQPYLVKVAIDEHILRGDWPGLSRIAGLFLLTLLAQFVVRYGQIYLLTWTGQRVVHDLRDALFAHVQRLPARFFDRHPVGRLMTRILNDVEAIGEMFASGVISIFGDVLTLAGVVVVMLILEWRLALVTFAAVPVLFAVAIYFRSRARAAYREVRSRIARMNAYLQESILGMTVVQLFGRERAQAREFAHLNDGYRRALFRRMRYDALLYAGVEMVGSTAIAGLLWWGGIQILSETLTFGVLVAFMEYTHRFFLPIRDVSAKYTVMQSAMVAAERIFGLLDTEPEITSPPRGYRPARGARSRTVRGHGPGAGPSGEIPAVEYRDVWFRYVTDAARGDSDGDGRTRQATTTTGPTRGDGWVLRGLSLRIAPGERVALVGATGGGKTTLARLLTRTYDVERGAVLVDGVDIREWDLAALRRHVGLVLQDVVVFTGTVEENLTLWNPEVGRSVVEEAARQAHVEALIRSLPGDYDAEIRERGTNLSHGQRQLLAVARALVYNPPVLVLDEATSSVDSETERLLQDALERLLRGRTSVTIAHRLSTVQGAGRIVVLHDGRVWEDGTHEALLRLNGMYAMLYELGFESERGPDAIAGARSR